MRNSDLIGGQVGETIRRLIVVFAVASVGCATVARADETAEHEHSFTLEIGPAAEWSLNGEPSNYGGSIAIEKEVIENWLELELGITTLGINRRRELSLDLLFKKPFHLSPQFEFMVGAGPSFGRAFNGNGGTSKRAEFALDFMFWPSATIGWFIEPGWTVAPATGRNSLGATGGLLIGF